jgi:hypothetical protein
MKTKLFLIFTVPVITLSFGLTELFSEESTDRQIESRSIESPVLPSVPNELIGSTKKEWKKFHAREAKCQINFPNLPEHVSHKIEAPEGEYELKYDAYISSCAEDVVFILLVAQYPDYVDQTYAQMSLEAFLNGILTYNPDNHLIFADLLLVNGHEALDFFIRAPGLFFKGRAIMVQNSLYLMAMECDVKCYDEEAYSEFVESLELQTVARFDSQ